MCGISAYKGSGECEKVLIDFLEKLEYRGYDSSGIAVKKKNKIEVIKNVGKVELLKSVVNTKTFNTVGIAHTRWATHGKVNKNNAHPHISKSSIWSIVHNGIITNYLEIKNMLISKGYTFVSETDSEVIAHMLEYYEVKDASSFVACVSNLKGSYAICAINNFSNDLYIAKFGSPIYVANNGNEYFVSSDVIAFENISKDYYIINDNEICIINDNNILFYDSKSNILDKNKTIMPIVNGETSKLSYSTYMEKEINEIPNVLTNILDNYYQSDYFVKLKEYIGVFDNIVIIGCGTAYHSGLVGATYLSKACSIDVSTYLASEFLCSNPIIRDKTIYIFVSQSGETADTLSARKMVEGKCLASIAITNSVHSTLARMCDVVLPVFAGPEIAVASTKSYNAQLMTFYLLSKFLKHQSLSKSLILKIKGYVDKLDISSLYQLSEYSEDFRKCNDIFVLGKYTDYFTALEASLKIREITYINCSALPSGELKHGTLALIDNATICFVILTKNILSERNYNAIHEIKARGGKIALISQFPLKEIGVVDYYIPLPAVDEELMDIVSVIPFQILALKLSLAKGIDADKPRNLAKSVTVE